MRIPALFRRRRQPTPAAAQIVDLAIWNDGAGPGPLTPISRPDALDPLAHRIVMAQPVRADVLLAVSQLVQELAPDAVDGGRGDILDHEIEDWRNQWFAAIDAAALASRATALRLEEQQTQDLAVAEQELRRLRTEMRSTQNTARHYRDSLLGLDTPLGPPATITPTEAAQALPGLQTSHSPLPTLTGPGASGTQTSAAPPGPDAPLDLGENHHVA
jgi:hypothetical protein